MNHPSRALRQAVRLALATAASSAAVPLALGQTAPAAPPPQVEEVVVTGSRLLQAPNEISISPITSVTSEDIQKTGMIRVEDVLNMLPQAVAEQQSGNSISSTGTATVSLRGLGSQRTLVLINGKRMQPGGVGGTVGSNANAADINQIPAELIERADVLTGGASSVYGADAVAGVVNFVLNTHYEGVKFGGSYGWNNHKNDNRTDLNYLSSFGAQTPQSTINTGQNRTLSVIAGSNFADGRGNATVYATFLNSSPAVGYQYDHAGCTLNGGSTPNQPITCGGSSTSSHGRFLLLGVVAGTTTALLDNAVDPATGSFRAFQRPADLYNYGSLSYFQRQHDRWTAGGFLHFDVSKYSTLYSETMYSRNANQAQYGPSGAFAFVHKPIIQCNNPLLTAQEVAAICTPTNIAANHAAFGLPPGNNVEIWIARRNVEGGGRLDNYGSDAFRQVLGLKGAINDVWTYDAYAQAGLVNFRDVEGNFLGDPQITNALDVIPNPAKPNGQPVVPGVPVGAAVCASRVNGSDPNCVPWDIWAPGYGGPSSPGSPPTAAQQLAYVTVPSSWTSTVKEYVFNASTTGDLGKHGVRLPTANSGLNFNIGMEYRGEDYDFNPDYIFANGFDAGGNGAAHAIHGLFHVWEGFTEFRMPFINEKPGAYLLSLDAGYRYSSYTLGFNTNTYKVGLEWAPISDVRLRGGYNRAVRAPDMNELFSPAIVGSGGTADPCWGPNPQYTLAQCQRTHVTPAQYGHILVNPAAQINTDVGGNSALIPEVADTYTVGLVIQPQAVPNLAVSIDYFNIKIKQTITSLSSNTIISDCANTGDPTLCGLIHRGPLGTLWVDNNEFVTATFQNIGQIATKGTDLVARYRWDLGGKGRLNFGLTGTYTKDFLTQPLPTGASYNCAGLWGATCGAPLPTWRHLFQTDWVTPWMGLDLVARWRLVGKASVDASSSDPQLKRTFYPATAHIPNYNYIDLAATLPIGKSYYFMLGVNNVADKNPPLILNGTFSDCPNTSCNDNTWTGTYDTLGRYIFFNMTAQF